MPTPDMEFGGGREKRSLLKDGPVNPLKSCAPMLFNKKIIIIIVFVHF